jgi:hypothetical protein
VERAGGIAAREGGASLALVLAIGGAISLYIGPNHRASLVGLIVLPIAALIVLRLMGGANIRRANRWTRFVARTASWLSKLTLILAFLPVVLFASGAGQFLMKYW